MLNLSSLKVHDSSHGAVSFDALASISLPSLQLLNLNKAIQPKLSNKAQKKFPSTSFPNLKELLCRDNHLSSVASFHGLVNLKLLDLANN